MTALAAALSLLLPFSVAADSAPAGQPRRPKPEELSDIVKELKDGLQGFRDYKRLEPKPQAMMDRIVFRMRQLHSESLPDDVFDMLLEWEKSSKEAAAAKGRMESGFQNAVAGSLKAFQIEPGEGEFIVGGPFDGARAEWKPEVLSDSQVIVPSPNSRGASLPGPRVVAAVPAGRLGVTEPNGELFVTAEGLMLLGDYLSKGRDDVAAGYLGLILYHETLHHRILTSKGWHRAYEVDEREVRTVSERSLGAFFDESKDKDVVESIKKENAEQRREAILPALTGGFFAGTGVFGTRTDVTDEELAEMQVQNRRHHEELERIATGTDFLQNSLNRERERRSAEARAVAERANSAQAAYRSGRIPPSSVPRLGGASPVRLDTVEFLWRVSQRACSKPPTLTQDLLNTWWHLHESVGSDESIAGTLQGCQRLVFLKLLAWKAHGVNRVDIAHVQNLIPTATPPEQPTQSREDRRGAPQRAGVDYNHCIDPGNSCFHKY